MKYHLLLVEDEEFLMYVLCDNLIAAGCEVDIATNGEEALEHIKKKRPDLVILDLVIPKKNGFDVLKEIKENPELESIPVVILSNLGSQEDVKRGMELGASDYIVKSQNPIHEVIARIKKILESSQ